MLNYISWQSQYYTAAHLQMHICSRLIKTPYTFKYFPAQIVEAMQRKAGNFPVNLPRVSWTSLSLQLSFLHSFLFFCFVLKRWWWERYLAHGEWNEFCGKVQWNRGYCETSINKTELGSRNAVVSWNCFQVGMISYIFYCYRVGRGRSYTERWLTQYIYTQENSRSLY